MKKSAGLMDRQEFARIKKEFKLFEERREGVIQTSRKIITLSKQIIFAMHRNDSASAKNNVSEIKKLLQTLPKDLFDANIQIVAKQEFAEAICFYEFCINNRIPSSKELGIDDESYLLGLCDLTGELSRKAVIDVIGKKYESAKQIHNLVEEIYGLFLEFDLRNGELRKKSDSIKWNLKRLDDLMYDIRFKDQK